jgi:hypothetical protein
MAPLPKRMLVVIRGHKPSRPSLGDEVAIETVVAVNPGVDTLRRRETEVGVLRTPRLVGGGAAEKQL